METCYVGFLTGSECHSETYSKNKIPHNLNELPEESILLLNYRLQEKQFCEQISDGKICNHHKLRFLDYFSTLKYKCCDPLKNHKKNVTNFLRVISLEYCENFNNILSNVHSINLIPGDKWCRNCETTIKEIVEKNLDNSEPMDIEDAVHVEQSAAEGDSVSLSRGNSVFDSFPSAGSLFQSNSQEINAINNILIQLNIDLIDKFKLSTEHLQK